MGDPKALLAVIVLTALLVWMLVQGGWKSASGALLIALAVLTILQLLGLW